MSRAQRDSVGYLLNQMVEELKKDEDVLAIYLRGSVVEDSYSVGSDIDISVITTGRDGVQYITKEGMMVHLICMSKESVESAIKDEKYFIIHELRTGKLLFQRQGTYTYFRNIAKRFSPSRRKLIEILDQASSILTDAIDLYNMRDYYGAILNARLASLKLAQAFLVINGVYDIKQKWIMRNVQALSSQEPINSLFAQSLLALQHSTQFSRVETRELLFALAKQFVIVRELIYAEEKSYD